jgi:hypothetical protein
MALPSRYPRPVAPQVPAVFGDRRKGGDASLGQRIARPAARPGAIGRLYRFDASNCQSAPDFANDLTPIKGSGGIACEDTFSLVGCEGAFRTPNL